MALMEPYYAERGGLRLQRAAEQPEYIYRKQTAFCAFQFLSFFSGTALTLVRSDWNHDKPAAAAAG